MINAINEILVEGTLVQREETKHPSDKFRYREIVLEVNSNVDGELTVEFLKLKVIQERCDLIDDLRCGFRLQVMFKITGRKYKNKMDGSEGYWTNLEALNITLLDDTHNYEDIPLNTTKPQGEEDIPLPDGKDELPF